MALVAYPGKIVFGPFIPAVGTTGTLSVTVIDSAADQVGVIFQPLGTLIDKAAFRVDTFTTLGNVDVFISAISATTGLPTGAALGSTVNVAVTASGVYPVTGLNTTVNVNTKYALVIKGEVGFAGSFEIRQSEGTSSNVITFPYGVRDTTGTWIKVNPTGLGHSFGIGSDTAFWHIPGLLGPYDALSSAAVTSSSTPREIGNTFQPTTKQRLWGVLLSINAVGSSADFSINCYTTPDGTPTSIASVSVDADAVGASGAKLIPFTSNPDIEPDTEYALGVQSSGSNGITVLRLEYGAADQLGALFSTNNKSLSRATTGATSFTEDDTKCYALWPVFSHGDDGAGGGGGGLTLARLPGGLGG